MTEEKWDQCQIPYLLIEQAVGRGKLSRELRLVLCACSRALSLRNVDEVTAWFDVVEQFADQSATCEEVQQVNQIARERMRHARNQLGYTVLNRATLRYVSHANVRGTILLIDRLSALSTSQLLGTIRDIFGNPFRPVTFSPEWRTDTAVALARGMYESRNFGAMPILADALQDAGCDNDDILNHCREASQVHVRGCWVVDLVLGKA